MTSSVDAEAVLASLKGFQRDTVQHVFEQFYERPDCSGRFLVADETGLGKSVVAKGVVARAIEHLETDDSVDRIDIIYVCSNQDLAAQNLRRLNVTGERELGFTSRLTLLAKESARLQAPARHGGKKVNLVSFTPGTSFAEGGRRTGAAGERAMLTVILDQLFNRSVSDCRVTRLLLQGGVATPERFDSHYVRPLLAETGELDPVIVTKFGELLKNHGIDQEFLELRDHSRRLRKLGDHERARAARLIAAMRQQLAKASIESLEPDLVILDEFQRFRHLLDPNGGDAAELAHALFEFPAAKVLLLSATPYKPFTHGDDDEDHYRDFLATVRFLAGRRSGDVDDVQLALERYRYAITLGETGADESTRIRQLLLPLMSRSERPRLSNSDDLVRVVRPDVPVPSTAELLDAVQLYELAELLKSPLSLEYWKSIPYFVNFMENYRIGTRLADAREMDADALARLLSATQSISSHDVHERREIDFGNGKLHALAERTIETGMWKLLWMPASMPYLKPGAVYSSIDTELTKCVLFSSWSATPTAVSSLLSHETDRLAHAGHHAAADERVSLRLTYRMLEDGRPAAMSVLPLFWPHPELAKVGDHRAVRAQSDGALDADELVLIVGERLLDGRPTEQASTAYFAYPGVRPGGVSDREMRRVQLGDDSDAPSGLDAHALEAMRIADAHHGDVLAHPELPQLAAYAPGNIAWRALQTVSGDEVETRELWLAARLVGTSIRALFNRPDTIALLSTLYGEEKPYWQQVLDYCADGNLQAVLDEYVFQLMLESGAGVHGRLDGDELRKVAERIADALGLRAANYVARDNTIDREQIRMSARFAVRYGAGRGQSAEDAGTARMASVRAAFNSPFAPFVLASTSAGQEGIDFHWWSHEVVHWDLPSNPVDFEQREGRVNRFAGHAIRKNIAATHGESVLGDGDAHPWSAAFAAAERDDHGHGEFSPWWIYPGPARVNRVLLSYPFSVDAAKYERLRDELTLYRLTLGQPRQGDMVEMLARRGVDGDAIAAIDLRSPVRREQ